SDGVTEDGPAGVAEVERSGGVGGDELHVDPLAGERGVAAVGGTRLDHLGGDGTLGAGVDGDVEEAGPGDLDRGDPRVGDQLVGDQLSQGARVGAGLLGQLERDVGRVVPVTLLPGSFDRDL